MSTINDYIKAGYLKLEIKSINKATKEVEFEYEILSDECPIDAIEEIKVNVIGKPIEVVGGVYRFKEYGYNKMPRFLFGTDSNGHDIVKKAFSGLRTSLILGLCTSAFCLLFGLCWGAISGYFGGNIDLAMERFCEILSGVPWIVVMTLAILHLGNNFITFFLALCLTGWMGVAARTRTQFYRFKGREYILASRTLGSSDRRLIFRHILPNALGTIVTSSVLMIPSTIFSEATLAYLNLGLQGVDSFGVLMSENQVYIATQPHLIAFPAVIMALLMISFNLFGNGLRDALNPSLKGSE
jgi:oligopeptide transport system permease protein